MNGTLNDNDSSALPLTRTQGGRAALALFTGLAVVAILGAGVLLGGRGRPAGHAAQSVVPAAGEPAAVAGDLAVSRPRAPEPDPAPLPTARPEPESELGGAYVPTGADTEPAGLAAAEAGRIGRPALVWFHAHWCHVCQEIRPDMTELAGAYADRLAFITMNVDHADTQPSAARYRVGGTPTFVLLDASGQVVDRRAGWLGRAAMEDMLNRAIAAP